MRNANDVRIRVHGSWSGWRSAEIHLEELEDVHWCQPSGAPHRLVHGFVDCTALKPGDLAHRCDSPTPHRVRVCVLKHHVVASIYLELARRAEAQVFAASSRPVAAVQRDSASVTG